MPFIQDLDTIDADSIKRLVICSGKVYCDLLKHREENNLNDVAIARLEQFYPFPDKDIKEYFGSLKNVKDVVWCQEEPKNMGAWFFIASRFTEVLGKSQKLSYAGRQAAASPAAGQKKMHDVEQERLVEDALTI